MKVSDTGHIIMVDDNEGDIDLALLCYERAALDNPWMSFTNGKEFLAYLETVKTGVAPMPALVLLDLNMPGMSGIAVLTKVRDDMFFEALPIFCFLTSSSDPRDKKKAKELGAAGFVTKPDDIDDYVRFFESLRPSE